VVVILDELSEFLRSKPDARAFNEDIRFLQFLGEASRRMPLTIVASLQEHIETTGEIDQTTFGKIKDRYPVRFSLTGQHLRELASSRLIKKKPGAEAAISKMYRRLKSAFTGLGVSESDFVALYPVHPATVELLDDLLPFFSRHRGAVDFLHHQLAGDPQRQIPGMLDLAAETLLGPETILDHFRVRIQETLETAPFITVVLAFYEKEMPKLFPDAEDRKTALRLLKILILLAISPIRRRRRVAQLAEMLLYRVTDLDPAANYDFVHDLLEKMQQQGAYISVESEGHPHEDVYFVDLTADVALIIQRRVEALLKDPGFTLGRAVESLLPSVTSSLLPLSSLASSPRSTRRVSWQKTRREGALLFCRGDEDPLVSEDHLDEIQQKLMEAELDFCLILMAPQEVSESEPTGLLARLRDRGPEPYLIWSPRPWGDEPAEILRKAAARLVVRDHFRSEGSEVGKRVISSLDSLIGEDKELVESLFQRAYREGSFSSPLEAPSLTPADLPSLAFDRLLERIAEISLERRYPRHYLIAPTLELPATQIVPVQDLLRRFFLAGEVELRECSEALRSALDAHLRPLGLVKRTASGFRLQADPKQSELVRFILDRVAAGQVALDVLYHELRKGPFGLDRAHFDLAVLALVFSGQLTALSKGRKMGLETLDFRSLDRVDQLGPGEMVSRELQAVLAGLPFVPRRFKEGAFGYAQQRELWEHVLNWKAETVERADNVGVELDRARSYRSVAHLDLAGLSGRLERLRKILGEVKMSYRAREGLERLALACREEPESTRLIEEFEILSGFFSNEWQRYLFVQKYLTDPAMEFPAHFEELATRRDDLRKQALRVEAPLSPDLIRRIRGEFQDFLSAYGQAYEEDHRRQKSSERIEPLVKLREGRAYHLLQRLAEIRLISVDDDRVKFDRLIDGAAARTCSRLSPEDLRSQATCECGFRLGEEVTLPRAAEIKAGIERGTLQYLSALRDAPYREKVEASLFGLDEVGKKSLAEKIRQMLELDLEAPELLKRADKIVDRDAVRVVNAALAGEFVLVSRVLEDLAERLVERSFPKAKLMELVERWIDGESPLDSDDYVRIVSRSGPAAQVESRLRELIDNRYPELSPWWERVGEAAALREAVFAYRGATQEGPQRLELDSRVLSLLKEAFVCFVEEQPAAAAEALDTAERALSGEERESLLSSVRSEDDPKALLEQVFGERAFRFVIQEAGAKLLRMLVTGALTPRLVAGLANVGAPELPAPLERRLGVAALARALELGVEIHKTTARIGGLSAQDLDAVPAWEKLFRNHLALADLTVSELQERVRALGLSEEVDLKPLIAPHRKALDKITKDFERFYLDALPAKAEGRQGQPARLEEVFGPLTQKYRQKLRPTGVRFVLMDGMRWDVWHRLKDNLLPDLRATYRVVDEVALWSAYPTSTKVQLERAGLALPGEELRAAEPAAGYRHEVPSQPPHLLPGFLSLVGPQGEWVERLNLVDDKVHESTVDLVDLLREIELHSRRTLAVLLEEAPRGSLVLIFSDHGFREDGRWKPSARHKRQRYHHGGASPWEAITPLVVLYRT
jgi:hypothetical protein